MELDRVLKELSKIARERQVIKSSLCTEDMKRKLYVCLDERVKALDAELHVNVPPPKAGLVK